MTYPNNSNDPRGRNQGYGQRGYGNYDQHGYDQYEQYGQYDQGYDGYDGGVEYAPQKGLIAGRFETSKVVANLVLLALLGGIVTFAVVFLVDLLVAQFTDTAAGGVPTAVLTAVAAAVISVVAGLLYIPVSGTGNEHLFGIAVIALAVVAAVVWVLLAGLLDGDWHTLVTLAGIICTATIAYATPARIEAARVY